MPFFVRAAIPSARRSVAMLADVWRARGGFAGAVGFSQGAEVLHALLAAFGCDFASPYSGGMYYITVICSS